MVKSGMEDELEIIRSVKCNTFSLQCSDAVGWATGRASGLLIIGCRFVCGGDLTGALRVL